MTIIAPGWIRILKDVRYSNAAGGMATIASGNCHILPIEMPDVMTNEVELASWRLIAKEGMSDQSDHIVDCETIAQWLNEGCIEFLEAADG